VSILLLIDLNFRDRQPFIQDSAILSGTVLDIPDDWQLCTCCTDLQLRYLSYLSSVINIRNAERLLVNQSIETYVPWAFAGEYQHVYYCSTWKVGKEDYYIG
jgi:hypothetical protein